MSDFTSHRDEAERLVSDAEGNVSMMTTIGTGVIATAHATIALHDLLDERLPAQEATEGDGLTALMEHFGIKPESASDLPVDPDEALAKELWDAFWGDSEPDESWEHNDDRVYWLNVARTARKRIEDEQESRERTVVDEWDDMLARAEKAEAERDEAQIERYDATVERDVAIEQRDFARSTRDELKERITKTEAERDALRERIEALRTEVDRLRAGIEDLTGDNYDHTPDCVQEQEQMRFTGEPFWHPDCGRCWEDSLHALLNPTEGGQP